MKDDKVAQSLAVGDRKVARFTDQRYLLVHFKITKNFLFVSLNGCQCTIAGDEKTTVKYLIYECLQREKNSRKIASRNDF